MAERRPPRRRGRPQQTSESIDPEMVQRRAERQARQRALHEQVAQNGGRPPAPRGQLQYQAHILETSLRFGVSHRLNVVLLLLAAGVTVPALYLQGIVGHSPFSAPLSAAIFGFGVVGAAFILSWAAEAAEMDISQGLAIAFLALVTVLPEYAVSMYFAWEAGQHPLPSAGRNGRRVSGPCTSRWHRTAGARRRPEASCSIKHISWRPRSALGFHTG